MKATEILILYVRFMDRVLNSGLHEYLAGMALCGSRRWFSTY